jgi:hypothetical protein
MTRGEGNRHVMPHQLIQPLISAPKTSKLRVPSTFLDPLCAASLLHSLAACFHMRESTSAFCRIDTMISITNSKLEQ